jgi:hypothetical protein
MTKPTKPTVPPAPSRANPGPVFSQTADTFAAFQAPFADYLDALAEFVDERADEALAAAIAGDLPPLTGQGGSFPRAKPDGTAMEFRTPAQVRSDIGLNSDPENRIINGAFDFWQRGTSFTASGYGADRWLNNNSGGTVTQSRQAFALGDTLGSNSPAFFLRQAVSGQSLASHFATIQQRIEGVRSYAGQTITVLGWARRSSGAGNMAVEVAQFFGTGGSPSAQVTGAGQPVTLTGSWAPFAVTIAVPSIAGRTLGTDGNDYLEINFWTSAVSDFNARSGSLGLQTIGVDLWGIHIKLGTHTTAAVEMYRQPELGPELARCQRYYWTRGNVEYLTYQSAGNGFRTHVPHPVQMRIPPAMSLTSITFLQASDAVALNPSTGGFNFGATATALSGCSVSATVSADAEL